MSFSQMIIPVILLCHVSRKGIYFFFKRKKLTSLLELLVIEILAILFLIFFVLCALMVIFSYLFCRYSVVSEQWIKCLPMMIMYS